MIISKDKRANNIAEYILYMWQIEDIIRSFQFDLQKIETNIISRFSLNQENKKAFTDWYANLITAMKAENIETQGHLSFIRHTVAELNDFHLRLLNMQNQTAYQGHYKNAKPDIDTLMSRSPDAQNEIEVCLTGLYGVLVLKLQKKEISKETLEAVNTLSSFLANLSNKFKDYEEGKLEIE